MYRGLLFFVCSDILGRERQDIKKVKYWVNYWGGYVVSIKKLYLCTRNFAKYFINLSQTMNRYETVFILTPVLSDEQMKETVAKFEKVLTDNGAEILNKEAWGLKKLAYNIEKKTSGFYSLVEFKAEPTVIAKLETAYRRDEKVIRYMTVKLDKYAAAYAEKRRAKLGKKEEA